METIVRLRRALRTACLPLLVAACTAACSAHREPAAPPAPPAPLPGADAAATAGPQVGPAPAAKATDPRTEDGPCAGYTLDGLALDMPRSQVERISPLVPIPESQSLIEDYRKSTLALRARRPGRFDDIQLGFAAEGEDPPLRYIRARILVAKGDPWPASLMGALGSPKRAKVDEWIWWDRACRATLRLRQVESLGGGEGQPYLLEIRHTSGPSLGTSPDDRRDHSPRTESNPHAAGSGRAWSGRTRPGAHRPS